MNRFFTHETGFLRVVFACLLLSAGAARAVDAASDNYQDRVNAAMSKINQSCDDVQKELDEDYAAIAKERDKSGAAIADSVKALEQKRMDMVAKFNAEFKKFEDNMRTANIPASDKRYIDAATPLKADRESIDRTYENSLATLQQLYQLNSKRFTELMKIHNARESIESAHHREERAMATENVRREVQAGVVGTDAEKRAAKLREQEYEDQRQESQSRYNASLNALDDYRALVNSRLKEQHNYLSDYAAIMQDLNRTDITPANRADYAERLAKLNVRKDAEERQYQNNALFIEEKLTFEQMRGRELARAAEERRQVEEAWFNTDENYRNQLAALDKERTGAGTAELKKGAEDRIARLNERHAAEKAAYQAAVNNVEERQKLVQQAMDERLSYLESRNDIRLSMAKQPMTEETFDKYRTEIAKLEERRISGERGISDKLANLAGAVSPAYRMATVDATNPALRRARVADRIDGMKSEIQNRWNAVQAKLNSEADAVVQKLMSNDLTPAERTRLEYERASLNKRMAESQDRMMMAVEKLEGKKALEEKRMAARTEYIAKRNALRDGFKMDTAQYNDVEDFEKRLSDLDSEYARQEQEYFEKMRGIDGAVIPGMSPITGVMPNQGDADWNTEAVSAPKKTAMAAMAVNDTEPDPGKVLGGAVNQGAAANAASPANAVNRVNDRERAATANTVTNTATGSNSRILREEYREDRESVGEEVKDAWHSFRNAVVGGYHRAVDYLTD